MQKDNHYFATYCIARAAGITRDAAETIAHAAMYVDDNAAKEIDIHKDGGKVIAVPTAHHVVDIRNLDATSQRFIWIPFHFIPGCEGNSFTEKLVCRKDSAVARQVVKHNLEQIDKPFILELVGITSHVYQDTFSHYGFSGVSSRRNRVVNNSIRVKQSEAVISGAMGKTIGEWFSKYGEQGGLLDNIRSLISFGGEIGSGALGHGAVSNYPDLPFLEWSFDYEYPHLSGSINVTRRNPETFLESCKKLHSIYSQFAYTYEPAQDYHWTAWELIEYKVKEIIANEGNLADRCEAWREAMREGVFCEPEEIPEYDVEEWREQHEDFSKLPSSEEAAHLNVYRFFQAAAFHQNYMLRELLPEHGLVVV